METNGEKVIQLELKYCERCGGLWLRRKGADKTYCAKCAEETAEFPLRRRLSTRPRLPVNRGPEIHGQLELIRTVRQERSEA